MKPVSPDNVCPAFDRAPDSLIEEPEVCELCGFYDDGFCKKEDEAAPICGTVDDGP